MDQMLDAPHDAEPSADEAAPPSRQPAWWRSLQAESTRRALLLTALGALLIAGVITAIPGGGHGGLPVGLNAGKTALGGGSRGNATFDHAVRGTCLNWPEQVPDAAQIVDCKDEHRFEVADRIDMRTFPGTEYGPDAAPPSEARIRQISQEQCQAAARQYLGAKYDPNGRFSVSLVWSGDKAWRQADERRMLCGLQLAGPDNHQLAFAGKVADVDQSKVWPAGTCLGIDPVTNQPTDIPTDCAKPHAMEVTGAVNLAEKFPGPVPPDGDQDQFVKDACTRMTDAYLAPVVKCEEHQTGMTQSQTCGPVPDAFYLQATEPGTPATLSVTLTRGDDEVLLDESGDITYTTAEPNGPECGPTCKQAFATHVLELE